MDDVIDKEIIIDAFFAVKDVIKEENEDNTALLTKNNSVFGKVQEKIKKLTTRYNIDFIGR